LPLLPHLGRDCAKRRRAPDRDLHDLPFADLDQCRELAPVRQSLAENKPLRWRRVYTLPDYVYFDHSIHVAKGVGCTECHGPIGDMPLTWRATDMTMRWCLDCHRNPAPRLRPREAVFNPHWRPTSDTPPGAQLMAAYRIHPQTLTDCTVCHR